MSTAILTVLSNIPWGQVIDNAPKLADGASKLWAAVSGHRRKKPAGSDGTASPAIPLSETDLLKIRVDDLETTVRALEQQMCDSSILIKALAEQNTQLVRRIELNRIRLRRFGAVAAVFGSALAVAFCYLALNR